MAHAQRLAGSRAETTAANQHPRPAVYDVHYVFADDTEESVHVARVGPEAVAQGLQAGDRQSSTSWWAW